MNIKSELTPLEAAFAEVFTMDTCGFFTGNGTFGLEKRDRLVEALKLIEQEHAALVETAAAANAGYAKRYAATGQEERQLHDALANLATIRASNKTPAPTAEPAKNPLLTACKRLLDLANDPAGGTLTLKEVFGFPSDHRQPQLEGAALLLAITRANNNQPYKPS